MKKLGIVARLYTQDQRANLIQNIHMAEAFGNYIDTTLITDKSRNDLFPGRLKFNDIIQKFGIKENFNFIHFFNLFYLLPKSEHLRKKFLWKQSIIYTKKNNIKWIFTRQVDFAIKAYKDFFTVLEIHDHNHVHNWQELISVLNAGKLKILAISYKLKEILIKNGINAEYIFVQHDGVSIKRFQSKNLKKLFITKKKTIGYSGHLYEDRGIDLIIKIAKNNPEFDFYIAGGFKRDIKRCINLVHNQGVKNMHFLGMLPYNKIPDFLYSCDYLIMPYSRSLKTIDSCSPLKLFEYMASGKTIITSNIPTILEVLNNNNALIFETDNFNDLQKIFQKIKNSEINELKLKKQVLNDVKKYTWNNRAKYILDIFKDFDKEGTI